MSASESATEHAIKLQERVNRSQVSDDSVLANIPVAMAPLKRAQKIQQRCAKVGFDWTELSGVVDKIHEELDEVLAEVGAAEINIEAVEEEIGDLLFAVVNLARHTNIDAETALLKANLKFEQRFRLLEQYFLDSGRVLSDSKLQDMELAWQHVKHQLKNKPSI